MYFKMIYIYGDRGDGKERTLGLLCFVLLDYMHMQFLLKKKHFLISILIRT